MMHTVKPLLTVFTPTWNRADLLPRLLHSIVSQMPAAGTVEWLVIDDGSTDNTPAILANFAEKYPELVRWLRLDNGGKHRAINRAADEARADWIMLVDSDDTVAEGAIGDVLRHVQRYGADVDIGLLRGLKNFPELGGSFFSFHTVDMARYHWQWISSQPAFDSAEIIRRSALALHPFPEYDGERFMAESWLWHALDSTHKMVCVNRQWVNCWYQDGGLTARALLMRLQSLHGAMDVYRAIADSPSRWRIRARASINGWRYRFHAGTRGIKPAVRRPPWWFSLPGWLLYRRDQMYLSGGAAQ